MAESNQITRDQMMEIIKNVVVSVDINQNAVVISTKKLLSYFMKNVEGLERIIKVDVDKDKNIVVYASVRPTNPNLLSIVLKVTIKSDAFNLGQFKHEVVKGDGDVYIKLYVQQNVTSKEQTKESEEEADF